MPINYIERTKEIEYTFVDSLPVLYSNHMKVRIRNILS